MTDTAVALTAWHERLFIILMVLEDVELRGAGFVFDYSRASLPELERRLLDRIDRPEEAADSSRRALVEGAAAYLGEALMRAAGGAWAWSVGSPPTATESAG